MKEKYQPKQKYQLKPLDRCQTYQSKPRPRQYYVAPDGAVSFTRLTVADTDKRYTQR